MLRTRRLSRFRPLFNVVLIMLVWTTGSGVLWFLLPQIVKGFFSDVRIVGLVIALPNLLAMVVDLPAGDMVDRAGRKKVLLFGFAVLALLGFSLMHVHTAIQIILFLACLGLIYQMIYISVLAHVMDVSPKKEYSTFLGVEMSFMHLGFALGPIIAGVLVSALDFDLITTVSLVYGSCCLLALAMTLMSFKADDNKARVVEGIKSVIIKDKFFVRELLDYGKLKTTGLVLLLLTFLFTFYDGVVWLIQPLYYTRFSGSPLYGGAVMSAFVIPLVLFEVPAGALADRFGRRKILICGLLIAGLFSIMFSYAESFAALFFCAFAATTGLALAWPSAEGILSVKTPSDERGKIMGVWSLAYDFGYVIGPLTAGLIASYIGEGGVFAILGGIITMSAVLVLAVKED